jgi:hypothetical protein
MGRGKVDGARFGPWGGSRATPDPVAVWACLPMRLNDRADGQPAAGSRNQASAFESFPETARDWVPVDKLTSYYGASSIIPGRAFSAPRERHPLFISRLRTCPT